MTDIVTSTAAAPAAPATESKAVGEHEFVDAAGAPVENIEEATGVSYVDLATKETFAYQIPGAVVGSVVTMFALFGARTRVTNAASAARQKRARDATYVESDVTRINGVFAEVQEGQWAVTGEGVRAPAYDLEILADVVTELATRDSGRQQDREKILAKLKADLKWRRGATGNPDVKLAYLTRIAAGGVRKGAASLAID